MLRKTELNSYGGDMLIVNDVKQTWCSMALCFSKSRIHTSQTLASKLDTIKIPT